MTGEWLILTSPRSDVGGMQRNKNTSCYTQSSDASHKTSHVSMLFKFSIRFSWVVSKTHWVSFQWITWLWVCEYRLLLTRLSRTACIISPCIVFHLLQCHGSSASPPFCLRNAFFHQLSLPYPEKKIPVSGYMSQHLVSSNPSLSLLIASLYCAHSNTPRSIFVSISCWITEAMQKTIWHDVVLKRASLCDAVLPCLL